LTFPHALQAAAAPAAYPKEQLELIRRTVAKDATPDELALFLYDNQRRGIHPLDKLLHFTKRGGRYTPVTSIDFMRAQAAASGEMAGSDDPVFEDGPQHPTAARVVVYRITQGQRFAYSATARWDEYCPDAAPMWKRMPHTMLGKCAEALALRKAFPQQLAGLYAKEEMDQADGPKAGYVVETPAPPEPREKPAAATVETRGTFPPLNDLVDSVPVYAQVPVDEPVEIPEGAVLIVRVDSSPTKNANVTKYLITDSNGETFSTIKSSLGALAEQLCQERVPVTIDSKETKWGFDLVGVRRAVPPLTSDEIPF